MTTRSWTRIAGALLLLFATLVPLSAATQKKANYLEWGDSPEAYLLTPEERAEWDKVLTKEDADKFITNYWAKHGDAFHKALQQRIDAADKYFGISGKNGAATERGRVFIILGSPSNQRTTRQTNNGGGFSTGPTGPNSIEQSAVVGTEWEYKTERLPKELGVPNLIVRFQTDVARGYETIENPGLVEPYLKRAAAHLSAALTTKPATAPGPTPTQTKAAVGAQPSVDPTLWSATANLNGAYFTGESFISPNEKTFYAYSFYLPASVAWLAGAKDIVMVGSIKDANGSQVTSFHQPATPASYDATGDRYADGAVQIAPGKYTGMFALYAADGSTLLASSRSDFEVPDLTVARVTRPFLTSHIDTLDKQGYFDPWTFVAMKYAVKGNSTFKKSDSIGWFTYIANPTANPNPSMTMRMKVSKNGKVIDTTPPMPADLQQTGPHTYLLATRFDPNTLEPGHYALELTLKDMNAPKTSDAYTKGYVTKTEFDVVQ